MSRNEEGQLVARMLRRTMYGVEASTRTYPTPPAAQPERPATPSLQDTGAPGAPSYA